MYVQVTRKAVTLRRVVISKATLKEVSPLREVINRAAATKLVLIRDFCSK